MAEDLFKEMQARLLERSLREGQTDGTDYAPGAKAAARPDLDGNRIYAGGSFDATFQTYLMSDDPAYQVYFEDGNRTIHLYIADKPSPKWSGFDEASVSLSQKQAFDNTTTPYELIPLHRTYRESIEEYVQHFNNTYPIKLVIDDDYTKADIVLAMADTKNESIDWGAYSTFPSSVMPGGRGHILFSSDSFSRNGHGGHSAAFNSTLDHEIGHALGRMHPQDTNLENTETSQNLQRTLSNMAYDRAITDREVAPGALAAAPVDLMLRSTGPGSPPLNLGDTNYDLAKMSGSDKTINPIYAPDNKAIYNGLPAHSVPTPQSDLHIPEGEYTPSGQTKLSWGKGTESEVHKKFDYAPYRAAIPIVDNGGVDRVKLPAGYNRFDTNPGHVSASIINNHIQPSMVVEGRIEIVEASKGNNTIIGDGHNQAFYLGTGQNNVQLPHAGIGQVSLFCQNKGNNTLTINADALIDKALSVDAQGDDMMICLKNADGKVDTITLAGQLAGKGLQKIEFKRAGSDSPIHTIELDRIDPAIRNATPEAFRKAADQRQCGLMLEQLGHAQVFSGPPTEPVPEPKPHEKSMMEKITEYVWSFLPQPGAADASANLSSPQTPHLPGHAGCQHQH